jgi:lipopolysaccharide/colanic/teichoic acid biosynthesis glycosyltransferase
MGYKIIKRLLDVVVSLAGLLAFFPFFGMIAVLVKLESRGPVIFPSPRVGRKEKTFRMYKFRTMIAGAEKKGPSITPADDPRVTRLGAFLRKYKLDEWPQLFNVLKGDMSLVGPRPEVSQYVSAFREDYREILRVRPGITDFAALAFRNESQILAQSQNPELTYLRQILPQKIEYYKRYLKVMSLKTDLSLIVSTLRRVRR